MPEDVRKALSEIKEIIDIVRVDKIIAVLLAAVLISGTAAAQKYAYQVGVSSKDVNLDLLDLPGSTPLEDVLAMLPEFLGNSDLSLAFGQYDVQIEGISVDVAANAVLKHMHLSDLKSISISESPSASQQKNSSGGVINLKLNDVPDGFSGRASVNVSSRADYQPSAMLNYHKDKLTVRSWLMLDLARPGMQNEYRTLETMHGTIYAIDTTGTRSTSQMARIYADFNPTSQDAFQFRVWESTSSSDNYKYMRMLPTGENDAGGSSANETRTLSATAAYTHKFHNGHKFNTEWGYLYMPQYGLDQRRNTLNVSGDPSRSVQTLSRQHQVDGKISYSLPLVKSGDEVRLEMKAGANMTVKSIANEFTENSRLAGGLRMPSQIDGDFRMSYPESSFFVSPYIELGGGWPKLQYKANLKFQHLKTTSTPQGVPDDVYAFSNDLTGNFNIAWQMAPHHHLRLVMDRSIIRPSNWQMIPVLVYRPDKSGLVLGNPDLLSSKLNSVNLNYITDMKVKKSNMFVNVSAGLIYAEGLITPVHDVMALSSLMPYVTYENQGSSDIFKANILFCLTNGPLMLTFSSNFFDKLQKVNDGKDMNMYYNLSLGSVYRISDKWSLSAEMTYNNPVSTPAISYSPAFNGHMRISKVWNRLESYIVVVNVLHKTRCEVTTSPDLTTYRYYDLYPSSLFIGLSYHF